MKNISRTDRYILIGSIGVLLISFCVTFDKMLRQRLKKEQIQTAEQEVAITDTLNIKTWRLYHTEQMILMHEILKELRSQNNSPIPNLTNESMKVNFKIRKSQIDSCKTISIHSSPKKPTCISFCESLQESDHTQTLLF